MAVTRFLRIFFGLIASAMLMAGLGDVLLHGQLSVIPRTVFAGLIGVVIVFLLHGYLTARRRSELLDQQAGQLQATAASPMATTHSSNFSGSIHVRPSGGPLLPTCIPKAVRRCLAVLPALKPVVPACAMTSMCAPPMAGVGWPGKITRCATRSGASSKCRAPAAI